MAYDWIPANILNDTEDLWLVVKEDDTEIRLGSDDLRRLQSSWLSTSSGAILNTGPFMIVV